MKTETEGRPVHTKRGGVTAQGASWKDSFLKRKKNGRRLTYKGGLSEVGRDRRERGGSQAAQSPLVRVEEAAGCRD